MDRRRPGVLGGLLIAAMLTAALTGILFFAWRVAGLPFVPFDTFDWLTRVLPGRLIAFGICTMVSVIRLWDLGPISSTAKAAERQWRSPFLLGLSWMQLYTRLKRFGLDS